MLYFVKSVVLSTYVVVKLLLLWLEEVSLDYGQDTVLTVVRSAHNFTNGFKEVVDIHALIYV